MALQAWFPLNGNLDNFGISDVSLEQFGGVITNAYGKIGSCYTFDGVDDYFEMDGLDMGSWSEFSITMWVKPTTAPIGLFLVRYVVGQTKQFNVHLTTGGMRFRDTGNSSLRTVLFSNEVVANEWTHLAFVYNHGSVFLYRNGLLDGSYLSPEDRTLNETLNEYRIGRIQSSTDDTFYTGLMNDFRIYDHAISARDVYEISKGLIVHHPLSTREILMNRCSNVTWNQLLTNGDFSNGTSGWSGYTPNTITQISVENNELTVTKVGGTVGGYAYVNNVTFDTTHLYYVKAAVKALDVADHDTHYATFGFSLTNGTVGGNTQIYIYSLEYTTRSFVSSPVNAADRLVVRAGKGQTASPYSVKCKNIMCVDLTLMFGAGNEPSKELCDEIFWDDWYPYDAGTVKSLSERIWDRSGFGYDGTVVNTSTGRLSLSTNTPRYDMSTVFDGNSYISINSPTEEAKSASFWIKWNGSVPNMVAFVDNKSRLAFGVYASGLICSVSTSTKIFSKSGLSPDTWYHIVVVNEGDAPSYGTRTLYINGVKQSMLSTTNYWSHSDITINIGGRSYVSSSYGKLNGQMSDFRMYATALKAEDVLDLYRTSASVDDCGNLHTFNLAENKSNIFNYDEFLKCSYTYFGWTSRNGEYALKINPTYYYRNSTYTHIFEGDFLPNTQYKFDLWVDADDCLDGNNINRPAGIWVYYTDNTRDNIYITGNSSSPIGFQHKVFYTNPEKSVSHIQIYYYVGTGAFYRWDSMIIPVEETVNIEKDGTTNAGYFREGCGEVFASIGKGGNFDTKKLEEK